MALTSTQVTQITKLAVAMFGVAPGGYMSTLADLFGSVGGDMNAFANALSNTAAFKAASYYPNYLTTSQVATKMVASYGLTGAAATAATDYFTANLNAGVSIGTLFVAANDFLAATTDTNFTSAKAVLANKAAVAEYYTVTMAGTSTDLGVLGGAVSGVTATTDVSTPAAMATVIAGSSAAATGQTFTLTTGVDTLNGTANNDTFNATNTGTSAVLGGLDSVDGASGNDTFNIADTATAAGADFALPAGMTIKNIETLNITTNGAIGTAAGTAFDASGFTGLTKFTGTAAGAGTAAGSNVKVADTTAVTMTVSGANTTTIVGGTSVTSTGGTGATSVTGKALTDVTINKGGAVTINNEDATATANAGTTLKSVTLNSVNANSGVGGAAIDTITLTGATSATRTVTVTNATANHSLTINANGTGIDSASATSAFLAGGTAVTDTVATAMTINATGTKSSLNVSGSTAVKTLTLKGDAALTLNAAPAASVTKIDGSTATGALTLGTLNAAVVTLSTGSGADTFTSSATAKTTINSGAGNDVVTLGAALAAGSTVTLGDGDDALLGGTVVAASSGANVTTIDGGAGTDTVQSTLINAGNAAQFVNFERISIGNATVDASLLTGSTITGVSIDGSTGTGVLTGLTQSQSLYVNANNAGTSSTLTFTGVAGATDAYSINFNAKTAGTTAAPATVDAKIVSIEGIETVTVNSGSAGGVNANVIALKDAAAKSLTITGSQALTVTFDTAFGTAGATTGVATVDASAASGGVNVNLANLVAAANGVTVTGGAGKDTITAQATTTQTFTGGAGADTFNVALAVGASPIVTITDLASGDKIDLAGTIATAGALGAKVDVGAAISLATALEIANGATAAAAGAGGVTDEAFLVWFQYGGNTYIYSDLESGGNNGTLDATDNIVKITGLVDLAGSAYTTGATVTIA